MAGRNPREAFKNFITPIYEALRCITLQRLSLPHRANLQVEREYSVALNNMSPVLLQGSTPLLFSAGQRFKIIETDPDDERGPFKARTLSYFYTISTQDEKELLAFHWTPEETETGVVTTPHLHIGPALLGIQQVIRPGTLHKAHIPTGRVAFEAVIRCLITEFEVAPLQSNWRETLNRSEAAFTTWRTRSA